ncbi:MAG: alpha/beta fold hydrolase [Burkholderiales bacterium]
MNDLLAPLQNPALGYSIAGSGEAVVLLHSSLSHKGQWSALAQNLAATHRVIAIDLLGHGDASDASAASLDDEARRIETILHKAVGRIPPFQAVGHSYGGGVALRLARNLPDRVISLALYEPTAFHVLPEDDIARAEVELVVDIMHSALQRGIPAAAAEIFIDYWAGIGAYRALPPHRQAMFTAKVKTALSHFGALFNEPANLGDYAQLTMPVCLIVGDSSPASSRRVAEHLSRTFACCERQRVEAGHMGPITHPEAINPIIERFIENVAACPAPWWPIESNNRVSRNALAA